jgi:calcineurin-like phosphoesterase family protein
VQQPHWLTVFDTVQTDGRIKMAGHAVRLSHFPTNADHTDMPRHMEWRPRMMGGGILLHGHTHNQQKQSSLIERINPSSTGEQYESILEVHVGLDAWDNRLVPEKAIIDIINRHEEAAL